MRCCAVLTIRIEDAKQVFSTRPNVVAVWAFGSAKGGRVRPGADLDIGVLFQSKPGLDELASLRAELQKTLHFDEIDLVVLDDSSSILRFEATSGRRIYCRDAARCAEFVSLAAREYEDEMALIQRSIGARH